MVLSGEKLALPGVHLVGKDPHCFFGPLEGLLALAGFSVDLGDPEVGVRTGEIPAEHAYQRLNVPLLAGQSLHDVGDAKALAINTLRVFFSGTERADVCPLLFSEPPILEEPLLPQHVGVDVRRFKERVVVAAQLPLEEPSRQYSWIRACLFTR